MGTRALSLIPDGRLGYPFKTADSEGFYNGYTYHLKLLHKAGKTAGWTLHDLCRTFVSLHAQIGAPIHVAEKLVNHVSGTFGGVRGIYDRYSCWDEMVEATKRHEKHVLALVEGPPPKQ